MLYNGAVKLVDFGVAKATQSANTTSKVQGKFSYMAPEKLKGSQGDRRSDIFSLGCVMWEALTLKRLFRGGSDHETMKQVLERAIQPPSTVNGDVPAELDPIVMRALDRDPARRHGTAKELAIDIEELLRTRGYGARNDRVAKYMQETFKDQASRRGRSSCRRSSARSTRRSAEEVLDAAFSMPEVASGSPAIPNRGDASGVGDFSQYRRVTPVVGSPLLVNAFTDAGKTTEVSTSPFDVSSSVTRGPGDWRPQ